MNEQVIKLSENAVERIKEIMSKSEDATIGVRIGVKSGGCAGMSYVMEYAKDIKPNEEIIEDKGVKVLIDPKAIMYLLGTEMDYKKEKFTSQFIFKNLVKSLEKSLKERTFFKTLRKEVNTGANGTQDYVVKKGINKDTIATTRQ